MPSDRVFPISPQMAYFIALKCSKAAGLDEPIRPHDLRRTNAKLARAGGAPIEQIQAVLGHSSIQTTQRYLGSELELRPGKAATDFIRFDETK